MSREPLSDQELDAFLLASSPYPRSDSISANPRFEGRATPLSAARVRPMPRKRTRVVRWVAPIGSVAIVTALVAAVFPLVFNGRTASPAPATSEGAEPTPSPETALRRQPPQGVVATGTFQSPDGSTSGRVEVEVEGEQAFVYFYDVRSSHETVSASASLWSREQDPCSDGGSLAWGDSAPSALHRELLPTEMVSGDWTAFDEIDLTVYTAMADGSNCINLIVARAPLEWTMPYVRPALESIVDAGESTLARGDAEMAGDRVVAYVVASGDTFSGVASRFGITQDDIFYLNPARLPNPRDEVLYAGERLNLDITHR
jgi:hypothetical protein